MGLDLSLAGMLSGNSRSFLTGQFGLRLHFFLEAPLIFDVFGGESFSFQLSANRSTSVARLACF